MEDRVRLRRVRSKTRPKASGDDGADGSPPHDALDAVRRLESALEERTGARHGRGCAGRRARGGRTAPRGRASRRRRRGSPSPRCTARGGRRRGDVDPRRRRGGGGRAAAGAWPPSGTSWSPSSPPLCFPGRRSRVLVPMTKVQILGRRRRGRARRRRAPPARPRGDRRRARLPGRRRAGRREACVRLAASGSVCWRRRPTSCWPRSRRDAGADDEPPTPRPLDAGEADAELERLSPRVEALGRRLDALRDERLVLPGYLEPLQRLLPLVPELADLDDEQLRVLRLGTVALVLNTDDEQMVDDAPRAAGRGARRSLRIWSGRASTAAASAAWSCSRTATGTAVRALLGRAQVRQAALPEAFERLSLRAAVEAMRAPPGGAPAGDRRRRARARGAAAARMPRGSATCARRSPASSSGSRRSSGSARRSARSSPSAGFPGATWRALTREVDARLGAAVLVEDLATSPRDPRGAAADAQLARWHGRSSRSSASSTFRAPARSIRRC